MILCVVSSIQCSIIERGNFYNDLAGFCLNNGLIFLILTTTNDYLSLHYNARHAFEAFQKHNLRVRRLSYIKLLPELKFNLDTLILLTDTRIFSDNNTFQMYLKHIGNHKIQKTILVFTDPLNISEETEQCSE